MKVTKLFCGTFGVLLGFLLLGAALATPFDKSDSDLGHGGLPGVNSHSTDSGDMPSFTSLLVKDDISNEPYSKWAGVVYKKPPSGNFTAVQGTFTVPKPSLPAGEATVQIGFGGSADGNNYWMQVGIAMTLQPDGAVGYKAFHVWHPTSDPVFDDSEIAIAESNVITLRVETYSITTGVAIIENHSTGTGMHKIFNAPAGAPPLLGRHAEWFVAEAPGQTLANFGTVKLTDVVAYTSDGKNYGPDQPGSFLTYIIDDGKKVTDAAVTPGGNEVTITYGAPKSNVQTHEGARSGEVTDLFDPLRSRSFSSRHISNIDGTSASLQSGQYAGAMAYPPPGASFKSVSGRFIVPDVVIPADAPANSFYGVAFWLGLEGVVDPAQSLIAGDNRFLQSVVEFFINKTDNEPGGKETFVLWEWYPAYHGDLDITLSVGDVVALRVEAFNETAGSVTVENLNTGKVVTFPVTAPDNVSLTANRANWFVEHFAFLDDAVLLDFGTVTFTDCMANASNGHTVRLDGADTVDLLLPDHRLYTDTVIHENNVSITYSPRPEDNENFVNRNIGGFHEKKSTPRWPRVAALSPPDRDNTADGKPKPLYGENWAGTSKDAPAGNAFTSVSGTFTIPGLAAGFSPSDSELAIHDRYFAAIWIGIGGDSDNALLQTGIAVDFNKTTGESRVGFWFEFLPDVAQPIDHSEMKASVGDVISLRVESSSPTTGTVHIENETTKQSISKDAVLTTKSNPGLKGAAGQWIIEAANGALPLVDFGSVTFTKCKAVTADGTASDGLGGAYPVIMKQNDTILTDVDLSDKKVTIKYNPHPDSDPNSKTRPPPVLFKSPDLVISTSLAVTPVTNSPSEEQAFKPNHIAKRGSRQQIGSGNWAGAVLPHTGDESYFTEVHARFNVPQVRGAAISGSSTQFTGGQGAAFWVGLDGAEDGYGKIIQAGVALDVNNETGKVDSHAWVEWFPKGSEPVSDLRVSPGDSVTVLISAQNSSAVTVTFENGDQRAEKTIFAPADDSSKLLTGRTAEWIVENHKYPQNTIADFGSVTFAECRATLNNGTVLGPADATRWDLSLFVDDSQRPVIFTDVDFRDDGGLEVSYKPHHRQVEGPGSSTTASFHVITMVTTQAVRTTVVVAPVPSEPPVSVIVVSTTVSVAAPSPTTDRHEKPLPPTRDAAPDPPPAAIADEDLQLLARSANAQPLTSASVPTPGKHSDNDSSGTGDTSTAIGIANWTNNTTTTSNHFATAIYLGLSSSSSSPDAAKNPNHPSHLAAALLPYPAAANEDGTPDTTATLTISLSAQSSHRGGDRAVVYARDDEDDDDDDDAGVGMKAAAGAVLAFGRGGGGGGGEEERGVW